MYTSDYVYISYAFSVPSTHATFDSHVICDLVLTVIFISNFLAVGLFTSTLITGSLLRKVHQIPHVPKKSKIVMRFYVYVLNINCYPEVGGSLFFESIGIHLKYHTVAEPMRR